MTDSARTTPDYALFISLFSVVLALASFGWNVWSKFIFPKPKLKTTINWMMAVGDGTAEIPTAISLEATNFGPGEVTLKGAVGCMKASWFQRSIRCILKSYVDWPYSLRVGNFGEEQKLPVRLNVGESVSVVFPESILSSREIINLGYIDGYRREHFADRKSARKFRRAKVEIK